MYVNIYISPIGSVSLHTSCEAPFSLEFWLVWFCHFTKSLGNTLLIDLLL